MELESYYGLSAAQVLTVKNNWQKMFALKQEEFFATILTNTTNY